MSELFADRHIATCMKRFTDFLTEAYESSEAFYQRIQAHLKSGGAIMVTTHLHRTLIKPKHAHMVRPVQRDASGFGGIEMQSGKQWVRVYPYQVAFGRPLTEAVIPKSKEYGLGIVRSNGGVEFRFLPNRDAFMDSEHANEFSGTFAIPQSQHFTWRPSARGQMLAFGDRPSRDTYFAALDCLAGYKLKPVMVKVAMWGGMEGGTVPYASFDPRTLSEQFVKGVDARHGYCEVYRNPSSDELDEMCEGKARMQLGGIVTGGDVILWNRTYAEHDEIKHTLNLGNDWVPFYWLFDKTKRGGQVWLASWSYRNRQQITDDQQVLEICQSLPFFRKFNLWV